MVPNNGIHTINLCKIKLALVGANILDIFFNIDSNEMIVWWLILIHLYDIYEFVVYFLLS